MEVGKVTKHAHFVHSEPGIMPMRPFGGCPTHSVLRSGCAWKQTLGTSLKQYYWHISRFGVHEQKWLGRVGQCEKKRLVASWEGPNHENQLLRLALISWSYQNISRLSCPWFPTGHFVWWSSINGRKLILPSLATARTCLNPQWSLGAMEAHVFMLLRVRNRWAAEVKWGSSQWQLHRREWECTCLLEIRGRPMNFRL